MAYRVEFTPAARRDFEALPREAQARIRPRIDALADNPRPAGSKRIRGYSNRYRIRVGVHRVVYDVKDDLLLVLVLRIGHRSTVYRRVDTL